MCTALRPVSHTYKSPVLISTLTEGGRDGGRKGERDVSMSYKDNSSPKSVSPNSMRIVQNKMRLRGRNRADDSIIIRLQNRRRSNAYLSDHAGIALSNV